MNPQDSDKPTLPEPTDRDLPGSEGNVVTSLESGRASRAGDSQGPRRPRARLCRWFAAQIGSARFELTALAYLAIFTAVYWISFALRFDFEIPAETMVLFWISLPGLLLIKLPVYYFSGHFHDWWSIATFSDLTALIRAASMSLLLMALVDHCFFEWGQIPRAVIALDYILSIVALGTIRLMGRQFREQFSGGVAAGTVNRALMIGADRDSAILAYQIQWYSQTPYRICGLVDVEGARKGVRLGQIPVLGALEDLPEIAKITKAEEVLMTADKLNGRRLQELMEACNELDLNLNIIRPIEVRPVSENHAPGSR